MKTKTRIQHIVTIIFLLCAIAFGVFKFGLPILQRLGMAFADLWHSCAAYFTLLFTGEDGSILPTVQEFPEGMDTVLPLSWEEIEIFFNEWREIFIDEKTILAFLWLVFEKIALIASYVALLASPVATIIFVLWITHRKVDNDYAKDSKAVKAFEKFRRGTWWTVKRTVREYSAFFWKRWYYWLVFALVWAYNLNLLTIVVEFLAWYFYLCWAGSLDALLNIFVQIAKFAVDFSVVVLFIPKVLWWVIIYWTFHRIRLHLGRKALKKCIEHDNEYIDKYPGALFVTGKQRSKKTSMLAMLKMLFERIFRKKAQDKMLLRDHQFPFFPWVRMEKWLDKARAEHKVYMLYHVRRVIRCLRGIHKLPPERQGKFFDRVKRRYGYDVADYGNACFGYDTEYGMEYDDGLVKINLFYALEMYAQLYFIYHQSTPLDLSNLAIREDYSWKDHGNYPIFDGDLLKKTSSESKAASKYSHVIDFDAFRPGMKFDPQNPNRDAVEYGIGVVQEVDKERKNSKTRSAAGNKAAGELGIATQDNDGFEIDLKVRGQVALVDFVDFWVWLIDAQRVGDLGASNAELTNQIFIKGRAEEYLKLPFFELEDLLYEGISNFYDKIHTWFRSRKGSNTLLHHLIKLAFDPIFKAYDRIGKEFTAWKVKTKVSDGGDGEELGVDFFWILNYVTYRDRFASDVCKAFYEYRFARSKRGIDDIECYDDTSTDVQKMMKQNSYFTEDMTVNNGIKSRRRTGKQTVKK